MKPTISALAVVSLLAVGACSDAIPTPTAPGMTRVDRRASIITHNFPTMQFPTGITSDGTLLYVSTGYLFRPTYFIDPTTSMIVGSIPVGYNPRDLVYRAGNLLSAEVAYQVIERDLTGALVSAPPIPWRGGGIAAWEDSLYVGNQDADSVLVLGPTGLLVRKFATPMRPEGLVMDTISHTLWVVDQNNPTLYEMDLMGNLLRKCAVPYVPGPFGLGGVTILRDSFHIVHPLGGDPYAGATIHRIARDELVCAYPVSDSIDIKPDNANKIPPKSHGKIDVAALSTPSRDATTLVVATVRFGRTGTEASPVSSSIVDVDFDGDLDMLLEFRIRDTGIMCGDAVAYLKAATTVGAPFSAADAIKTIGCGP